MHVRTHECAVRVVVLDEWDEGGCDGKGLIGRNFHEIHIVALDERRLATATYFDERGGDSAVIIARRCCVRERVLLLFKRVEIDDFLCDAALFHFCVGRFDDAEFIGPRVERHVEDEPDVLTFGCVDGADAAVVRRVHVAHFETCSLRCEAAATECRERAEVLYLIEYVVLLHQLRELVRREKLADSCLEGARIDERDRCRCLGVYHRHPVLDVALHAREADAHTLFKQFACKTDAAEAQVVDVVALCARVCIQFGDVCDDAHDVLKREYRI